MKRAIRTALPGPCAAVMSWGASELWQHHALGWWLQGIAGLMVIIMGITG